ncbi:Abi family protein [Corynebacterium lowii]|uniref:Abi-like protein n=1 Tax=Corynebacterium lowii TaxID=1544413 RepID=A0A0Q0U4X3_9CORY|nr:Abi family protein [Corynebacterium lowii]KQB86988.1 Abi-like protein [Corynebacterium lowii]MDP9852431.1 hypothetical protein [Corynebacterium lowii]
MSTYAFHSNPEALYLWNTRITKAFLEDIQHVEVLLRNCVDVAVSQRYGERWYIHPEIPFDDGAKKSIRKAERRARIRGSRTSPPGRVIAELSFDFWAYLFTRTYATTVWPLVQKVLVGTRIPSAGAGKIEVYVPSQDDFKCEIDKVYRLRNRCAHHEPIVKQDLQLENGQLDELKNAIEQLASWIDPAAAWWIMANSRVSSLRDKRP